MNSSDYRMRDKAIDLAKGIAILLVYLGHSILYYPIQMSSMYGWCKVLCNMISSFNMPLFFIISGFLFCCSKKSNLEVLKGKVYRLFIPYLFAMLIVDGIKIFAPKSLSYNKIYDLAGGVKSILLFGGDRWFTYVLFLMFLLVLLFRKSLSKNIVYYSFLIALPIICYLNFLPTVFLLNKVFYYFFFFLIGYLLNANYAGIKEFSKKYSLFIYMLFIFTNILVAP